MSQGSRHATNSCFPALTKVRTHLGNWCAKTEKTAHYAVSTYTRGMSDTKERAVQKYLAFLENPELVGQDAIQELENQFSIADGPITKLRLLAEIDRVRAADKVALQEGFIRHAKSWAAENAIPTHAFVALGVELQVLATAGFDPLPKPVGMAKGSSKSSKQSAKAKLSAQRNAKPRAKSINSDTVEKLILSTTEPFTVRDIVGLSHATNATVSRVVGWLVAAKKVEKLGVLAPQGTRGIAPFGYQVKKPRKG